MNPFFDWCKTVNICNEKYSFRKYEKKMVFFDRKLLDVLLTRAEQSNYLFVKAETYKEYFESR